MKRAVRNGTVTPHFTPRVREADHGECVRSTFRGRGLGAGILSADRLADAWKLLERDGGRSLAAVLEERGWVTPQERVELERRLEEQGSVSTSQHHQETRGHLAEVSQAETLEATASIDAASNGSGATSGSVLDETVDLLGVEDSRPSLEAIPASVETMPMTVEAGESDFMSGGGTKPNASSASNTSNEPTIELPGSKTGDVEDQVTLGATGAEDGPGPLRLSALGAPLPESGDSRYTMTRLHAKGGHGQVWRRLTPRWAGKSRSRSCGAAAARATRCGLGLSRKRGSPGSSSIRVLCRSTSWGSVLATASRSTP